MSIRDIGIDLGTTNTLIYQKSKGIVLNEPSVIAVDASDGHIIAVGSQAKEMLGRTHSGIKSVRPVTDGVISDCESASIMVGQFIKKIMKTTSGLRPRALIGIPAGSTPLQKSATIQAMKKAGIRTVKLIEEPMASAIGAGLCTDAPSGVMIIDIGGGTTQVSVISLGGIVSSKTVRIGGDILDEAIINYVKRKYSISSGLQSAQEIKHKIATVSENTDSHCYNINGRNLTTGLPSGAQLNSSDIRKALIRHIYEIIDAVKTVLEKTPPELAGDILSSGIMLTGGSSFIDGIDSLISEMTGMSVAMAESPLESVALGLGKILDDTKTSREVFKI